MIVTGNDLFTHTSWTSLEPAEVIVRVGLGGTTNGVVTDVPPHPVDFAVMFTIPENSRSSILNRDQIIGLSDLIMSMTIKLLYFSCCMSNNLSLICSLSIWSHY